MPFTFAHPAVVLPINRVFGTRLSLSGLVIGSMVPDFEGFILVTDIKTYSHTWHGMFWLDLPLGLAIAFIFHTIVRDPLIDNLPGFFKKRLIGYRRLDWNKYFMKHWANVTVSLFIGIFSHLVWDDFTHLNGFFVRHISFLQSWHYIADTPYPVYKVLQLGTSVLGLLIVLAGLAMMPVQETVPKGKERFYWVIVSCIAAAFVAFRFLLDLDISETSLLLITTLSGGFLGLILAPVVINLALMKR